MMWLWLIPIAWTVALLVVYARRRPPATYAPMPRVTDTTTGMADRSRSERLSGEAIPIYCPHGKATSWCGDSRKGDSLPLIEHCAECNPDAVDLRPFDWTTDDGPEAA